MEPEQLEKYLDPRRPISRREQLDRFHSALEPLYWQAVRVRNIARSYRNFRVGCAVYAYREDAGTLQGRWRVFYGMNTKVDETSRPVCAEPIAIQAAYSAGCSEILGIIVVGEPQLDIHSKLECPTLHPCHECRVFMKNHPIIPRHVRIFTALPPVESDPPEGKWNELQTLNQILRLHGEST